VSLAALLVGICPHSSREEVEPDVRASWNADQRTEAWNRAYEKMGAKYQLVLPALPAAAAP
jgi:hypothetical protein